jgi:hypothetical protein
VIVFIAAMALGRIASVPSGIREIEEIPETTETTVPADTVRADTVPVDRVPASTLPTRTRMEPVSAKRAEAEETRAVPAQDTTGTVGSGTIQ